MGNSYQDHRINIGIFHNKHQKFSPAPLWMDGRSDGTSRLEFEIKRVGRRIKFSSRLYLKMVVLLALFTVNVRNDVQIAQSVNCGLLKNVIKSRPCEPMTKSVELVNHNFRSRYINGNKQKKWD